MSRYVRRISRKVYDKYNGSDYPLNSDNLNPLYNTDLEDQLDKALIFIHGKIQKAYKSYSLDYTDDNFDVNNPSVEGLNNDLDNLIRSLNKNPLVQLKNYGFNVNSLVGSKSLNDLTNPLIIDCYGISTLEDKSDDISNSLNNNSYFSDNNSNNKNNTDSSQLNSLGNNSNNISYEIKYVTNNVKSTWVNPNPTSYNNNIVPFTIKSPEVDDNYSFKGWYLDSTYNTKLKNNKFLGYNSDVVLYARIEIITDDDDIENDYEVPEIEDDSEDTEGCDVKELYWLKIILSVVKIIKILLNVVSTVLGIVVPLINITKEAQLAWINPPLMASIINRVSQKLMALMFSIIGTLLMKLWSMLNFDCISQSSSDIISQINEVLSGINSTLGSVDAIALEMNNLEGDNSLLDSIKDQINKLQEEWNNTDLNEELSKSMQSLGNDWKKVFTNPNKLYSELVPNETRSSVENIISQYNETKSNVSTSIETIKSLINKSKKKQKDPVGTSSDLV